MKLESSVTLFDDNKVEDRFAELQVTADGITSEVSRKVGNDEVISRINQSAEAVTINANKVNIDGVITAINNGSSTTINGGKITTNTLDGDRIIANTINGNRIIANTLSAGAIKADSGQFNTANIPDLNADKITSGDILANRMTANLVSAFQAVVSDLKALAATIGGFFIGDTDIHTKDVAITSNADNSVGLSSSVFTRTINGTSRSNLKFAIGSKFGVDKSGTLYANGANITNINGQNITANTINAGAIKSDSGTFNTANIPNLNASKITAGTLSADRIGAGSLSVGKIDATSGTFNTANIPNLSATKITTDTINIGRIPTTARNDTYITDIGNDGIRVHDSHTSNNSAVINSSGMEVFKGGTTDTYSVAKYGDSARIGKAASKHISIDATNGMQVWTGTESDSTNVAQFNDTVRVGKKNQGRIEISNGFIDVYTGTSNIQKVATFTQIGNAGGLQIYDNQLPSTPKIGTLFADSLSFSDNDDSGVLYWNSSRNDFHMSKPLSVAGHINPIGYVEDGYARYSTSIPNNTATQLAYVVLGEGTWMVVCGVRSPSNATGNRMANLSTTSGDSTNFDIIQRAVSGQPTQLQFTVVVTPTTATTYYLNACHDAGVTLSYPAGSEGHNNFIRAVRIA